MSKRKRIDIIIALAFAIILWVYVIGQVNPTSTTVVRDVPIVVENTDALESEKLTILSQDATKLNLTVSGQRTLLDTIKPNNFKASVDAGSLGEGEYRLQVNIITPDGYTLESQTVQTVKFVVEKIISDTKPVKVVVVNDTSDETEPYIVQVSQEQVKVSGATSLVNKVSYLKAELDTRKVTKEMQAYSVKLTPMDAEDKEVAGVTTAQENVSITALILEKKTVALNVPVIGDQPEGFVRTYDVPKVVTLKGMKSTLDNIDSISTKTLDLTGVYESTTIALSPTLPKGVEIAADSKEMSAKVTVSGVKTKNFSIPVGDIEIRGEKSGTIAGTSIKISVTGISKTVDSLANSSFKFYVDASDLQAGTHDLKLYLDTEAKLLELTWAPKTVAVTIE